jgi:putative flavoprotein involved in K+ transport
MYNQKEDTKGYDVLIIGGGQSALACAYFLRRTALSYLILDDQPKSGGAWQHGWDSLTLFSPSEYSSLPGWMMPKSVDKYPSRQEVIDYLTAYEDRYKIQVQRPVKVFSVRKTEIGFEVKTSKGLFKSRIVISATGSWQNPFIPAIAGLELFQGKQIHSAHYKNAEGLQGKKVLIVGNGNSGAQILAEVSKVAETVWAVQQNPEYLPDGVDGKVLFDLASAKYQALQSGKEFDPKQYNLGNIVMVPSVLEARGRHALGFRQTFTGLTATGVIWPDREQENFDVIIWCTGFRYATQYLQPLAVLDEKLKAETIETKSKDIDGLYFVGYGNWTGFASATLIGVGRSARNTINDIVENLKQKI